MARDWLPSAGLGGKIQGDLPSLLQDQEVEINTALAQPYAVHVQCAFLGWPPHMHEPLLHWTIKSHGATFAHDRVALAEIASEFEGYVDELLQSRRLAPLYPTRY